MQKGKIVLKDAHGGFATKHRFFTTVASYGRTSTSSLRRPTNSVRLHRLKKLGWSHDTGRSSTLRG